MMMKESRKKELEERLRQMIMLENKPQEENRQAIKKLNGAMVIRRRKGTPDIKVL
jgi:hypothetical protein